MTTRTRSHRTPRTSPRPAMVPSRVPRTSRLGSAFAALLASGLFLALPREMTYGPTWIPLVVVAALVLPLFVVQEALHRPGGWTPDWRLVRVLALLILASIALAEAGALALLIQRLPVITEGKLLFRAAVLVWAINLLVFSLSYWELDGGGPTRRPVVNCPPADFLFPQQTNPTLNAGWCPEFIDYLFLAFNTATAFSPTDTMFLSRQAKSLMMVQAIISLLSVGLILGRAVNLI